MENRQSTKELIRSLRSILNDIAKYNCILEDLESNDTKIDPYHAGYFIHSFFLFNTLYNYDWEKSFVSEEAVIIDTEKTPALKDEMARAEKFIRFFFKIDDGKFIEAYKDCFHKIVSIGCDDTTSPIDGIKIENLKSVKRKYGLRKKGEEESDSDYKVYLVSKKRPVIKLFENILKGEVYDAESIIEITNIIYDVRCNIFHGTKDLHEMQHKQQAIRLRIYANFLMAISNMLISYYSYLIYSKIYDDIYKTLNVRELKILDKNKKSTYMPPAPSPKIHNTPASKMNPEKKGSLQQRNRRRKK